VRREHEASKPSVVWATNRKLSGKIRGLAAVVRSRQARPLPTASGHDLGDRGRVCQVTLNNCWRPAWIASGVARNKIALLNLGKPCR
jgi:hypothetical protein